MLDKLPILIVRCKLS